MSDISLLEGFGYAASVIVAVSLMMNSIVKLRWYNLLGAASFSFYGFLINAYPVGILNAFIACADIYYLARMYSARERFTLIPAQPGSEYLQRFLDEYRAEISRIFPGFDFHPDGSRVGFYVLRNLVPAGLFIGTPRPDGTLEVDIDFVVPAYRDFKPGEFLFIENRALFHRMGFRRLLARSHDRRHDAYLRRVGFTALGREAKATLFACEIT